MVNLYYNHERRQNLVSDCKLKGIFRDNFGKKVGLRDLSSTSEVD